MELLDEDYKQLLASFSKLYDKNEEKKELGIHDYSLMNALLKKTNEVHLHSNFIYSMINPNGSHYCEDIFLKFFLESIGENDFIDENKVRVHKEKGKIDLLIENGEKFIIIENKLRAVDQRHQISRYVQYVKDKYIDKLDQSISIDDRIHIVYLSEYKKTPSLKSESIIGFEEITRTSKELIWKNENKLALCNDEELTLPDDTKLKFNRVRHSKELQEWVKLSKIWLVTNKPFNSSLIYAFNEYELILKRLDTTKQWRNLMTVDEYTLGLKDEEEQEKMYQFMEESSRKLNDYKGGKLFKFIAEELFKDLPLLDLQINGKDFKSFTPEHCINWFKKSPTKDKCRDVGLEVVINKKNYYFALGDYNIAFGNKNKTWTKNIICNRGYKNLFDILEKIKEKKIEIEKSYS